MSKSTNILSIFLTLCLFSGAGMPTAPKNIFWIQNKTSYTFTHLYIVPSEDGDADDEFEDDGTDHCATACADEGDEDNEFDPEELLDFHLGKGKYDLMLMDKNGRKFIEDDIEYHDNLDGISENRPFILQESKLKEIK
jgi:hypothetical protein